MSPISRPTYAVAGAVTTSWPESTTPSVLFQACAQQATGSPVSASAIPTASSTAPATMSSLVASEASTRPLVQRMTSGTKIGLRMMPVVVLLCAIWVFFLFWWRKRQARKAITRMGPPPVPAKDHYSFDGSVESNHRGSRVFNMAAFSTPIHDGRARDAQAVGESRLWDQTKIDTQRERHQDGATIARLPVPSTADEDTDSPIDRVSPFRLKRGDTVKRLSLGTEIASLWPSPPPPAWAKGQPSVADKLEPFPPFQGRFSRPQGPSRL